MLIGEPTYTCKVCGKIQFVRPTSRGYPPDVARAKLLRRCSTDEDNHTPDIEYRAGVLV